VAALAKAHEVVKVIRPSVSQGDNVVDFLHGRQPAMLQAFLAQRVLSDVRRADFPPFGAVTLVGFRVAFVTVIVSVHSLLMLGAVTAIGQLRTAGEPARLLRTSRHSRHLHSDKAKALQDFSCKAYFIHFSDYTISHLIY
jgi:hypothetical protein